MKIKDFADRYSQAQNEAFLNGNFDLMEVLESDDIVYHVPPYPDLVGRAVHKQDIINARKGCANVKMEWQYLAGGGNICALAFKSSGRFIGEIPGHPMPVGENYFSVYMFLLRVSKDRVAEVWAYGSVTISD
jgi:hypothetical protein